MLACVKDCKWCWWNERPAAANGDVVRRRNRAREADTMARECRSEIAAPPPWDFGDDNAERSNEVWRADVENDMGLAYVDFDGTYTVGA